MVRTYMVGIYVLQEYFEEEFTVYWGVLDSPSVNQGALFGETWIQF